MSAQNLPTELSVFDSFTGGVAVTLLTSHSIDLAALGSEKIVEFSSGITVVLVVTLLVTNSKNGNLLTRNIKVGEGICLLYTSPSPRD